jgi:hypothetical protein
MTVRFSRPAWLPLLVLLLAGCGNDADHSGVGTANPLTPQEDALIQSQVMTFCGACHNPPSADTFPRDAWYDEITLAYRLFQESNRHDITAPPMSDIVRWYRQHAPEQLPLRAAAESPSPIQFRRQNLSASGSANVAAPGVSFLRSPSGDPATRNSPFLFCDMASNSVCSIAGNSPPLEIRPVLQAKHPARIEVPDLDQNGMPDYLICELGSFLPEDHDRGRVLWMPDSLSADSPVEILVDGVGRVADVSAGDFDGDGDFDLVVAVFGWRATGQLLYLEQTHEIEGVPQFTRSQLDDRHGAIHVPVVDLDRDGDLDFVSLFSQEHELIEAFLNRGDGSFERQIVYLAGNPSYGSSGIELTDFDRDGDVDVLYTNGDTLDSTRLKPYHSVQWLENEGDFPFTRHEIGPLPGAMRAVSADLDGDNDLDVIASAWIPVDATPASPRDDGLYATLVWYEQQDDQSMACHVLVSAKAGGYMTTSVSDLNEDGSPDIVAGAFAVGDSPDTPAIQILWNEGRR